MMKKMFLKRLVVLCMAGGLLFSAIPGLSASAKEYHYPVSSAIVNYCDLSGDSFTVTDVRTNETKTFDGSVGKSAVLIYSNFGYTYTDKAVSYFADILPFLDSSMLDVFVIERSDKNESNIKSSAEQFDPDRFLTIGKLGNGKDHDVFLDIYGSVVGFGNSYYAPLIAYVNSNGIVYAYTTGSTSSEEIMDNLVAGGIEDNYRGRTVSPAVEKHTISEIRQFVKDHPVTFSESSYTEKPSAVQPYKLGKLATNSLQDALNMVNQIRYIAGLSYEVTMDNDYNELAQAASLVNAANGQGNSHYPNHPAGMDDELYQIGCEGASHSNLGAGYINIAGSIVYGYMHDGDAKNIDSVGHRRWVLNPPMGKTGFGFVESDSSYYKRYSAMYALDKSGKSTGKVSMWPAQNMPVEYFGADYPWSYSTGNPEDIEKVKVILTNTKSGKQWAFSNASSDGYFNVENSSYGLSGCIIFRPDSVEYEAGDKYNVKIEGLTNDITVEYDVYFFSLDNPMDNEEEEEVNQTTNTMFRLYNPNTSEHFYTASASERDKLVTLGWNYEGGAWTAPKKSDTPVYRLYNENAGDHHYTLDAGERDILLALGWKDEGIGWYSDDTKTVPIYREYNPNAVTGTHNYTKDKAEHDYLVSLGWIDEGIGWYGVMPPESDYAPFSPVGAKCPYR